MKAPFCLLLAALTLAAVPTRAVETYQIDPVHSSVNFKIKHLVSKVTGRFTDFSGVIAGDPGKPEETQVSVEINTASINTNEPKRDEHLRSAEFFDAPQFPHMSFVSKKVHQTGEDSAFVIGDLTLRGVTKEVILQAKFLGRGKDAKGLLRTGWEARTTLKRSDFGLTWAKAIEGTQVVGNDVEIELNIEAVQAEVPPKATTIETTSAPAPAPAAAPAAESLPAVFLTPESKPADAPAQPVASAPGGTDPASVPAKDPSPAPSPKADAPPTAAPANAPESAPPAPPAKTESAGEATEKGPAGEAAGKPAEVKN